MKKIITVLFMIGLLIISVVLISIVYTSKTDTASQEISGIILPTHPPAQTESAAAPPPETIPETIPEPLSEPVFYNSEYLGLIVVEDGYYIADYREFLGNEYEYAVYEMRVSAGDENSKAADDVLENNNDNMQGMYWNIIVLKNETVVKILRHNFTAGSMQVSIDRLICEADVDYDSHNDILLSNGSTGNHTNYTYDCYLQRAEDFVACPSFSRIANPMADTQKEAVLAAYAFSPGGRRWIKYYFENNAYLEKERLTEDGSEAFTEDGRSVFQMGWMDEIWDDGEWTVRECFTIDDWTGDEGLIYNEQIADESTYWGSGSEWQYMGSVTEKVAKTVREPLTITEKIWEKSYTGDSGEMYYKVEVTFPFFEGGTEGVKAINSFMEEYVKVALTQEGDEWAEEWEGKEDMLEDVLVTPGFYVEGTICLNRDGYLDISIWADHNDGGMRGSMFTYSFVFETNSGKQLGAVDIFRNPETVPMMVYEVLVKAIESGHPYDYSAEGVTVSGNFSVREIEEENITERLAEMSVYEMKYDLLDDGVRFSIPVYEGSAIFADHRIYITLAYRDDFMRLPLW